MGVESDNSASSRLRARLLVDTIPMMHNPPSPREIPAIAATETLFSAFPVFVRAACSFESTGLPSMGSSPFCKGLLEGP